MTPWEIVSHPFTITLAGVAASLVLTLAVKREPAAAQAAADYTEALEVAVRAAERSGFKDAYKMAFALDKVEEWLASRGIVGDARTVTPERVRADVEAAVARLFPHTENPEP